MTDQPQASVVRAVFEGLRASSTELARRFVDEPEAVVDDAAERFERMIADMAYVDAPKHPMAMPIFLSSTWLAMYLALADRGVDVHEFGAAALDGFTAFAEALTELPDDLIYSDTMAAAAAASQREARPGEFVFEAFPGDTDGAWDMNILSCGICHLFAKHHAMDLVPYLCATDDVLSDCFDQGLRRSGTIALGAHHCDFRYQPGGEPERVADLYPQKIRIRTRR